MGRSVSYSTLKVRRTKTDKGIASWQLSGSIMGHRVRLQSMNKPELDSEKARLEREAFAVKKSFSYESRILTHQDFVEAEGARNLLDSRGFEAVGLMKAVQYFCDTHTPIQPVTMGDAIEAWKQARRERGNEAVTIDVAERYVNKFLKTFPVMMTGDITQAAVKTFILDGSVGRNTRRQRKAHLTSFFGACVKAGSMSSDLTKGIEVPRHKKPLPGILTVDQCEAILASARDEYPEKNGKELKPDLRKRGRMLAYVSICLLSGIRPDECKRLSIGFDPWGRYFNLDWPGAFIKIEPDKTKTRSRLIPISEELCRILRWCRARGLKPGYYNAWPMRKVKQGADIWFPWTEEHSDILRHTYATYRYALDRDLNAIAHDMGNSVRELERSYVLKLVSPEQGRAFANLRMSLPVGDEDISF